MSDHDAAPDPIDDAYRQAEGVLDDEAARSARRARVLAAVTQASAAPPPARAPSRPGPSHLARGGWLAAAGVAGISALLVLQMRQPAAIPEPTPATPPAVVAQSAPSAAIEAAPAPAAPQVQARARQANPAAAAQADAAPPVAAAPAPVASPPVEVARAPAAPAAAPPPSSSDRLAEIAVTAGRTASQAPGARAESMTRAAPPDLGAKLRAAAEAGTVDEITALLAEGARVDAPDRDGDTALMKAIQGRRPAAAALLLRRGASLERTNRAGQSARDMAERTGDADLNRALGLAP